MRRSLHRFVLRTPPSLPLRRHSAPRFVSWDVHRCAFPRGTAVGPWDPCVRVSLRLFASSPSSPPPSDTPEKKMEDEAPAHASNARFGTRRSDGAPSAFTDKSRPLSKRVLAVWRRMSLLSPRGKFGAYLFIASWLPYLGMPFIVSSDFPHRMALCTGLVVFAEGIGWTGTALLGAEMTRFLPKPWADMLARSPLNRILLYIRGPNVPQVQWKMSNDITLTTVHGDITTQSTDCIVNAANGRLQHGGGIALAIARAGGDSVQRESDHLVSTEGPLQTGQVGVTTGGTLPVKAIVHAVGPVYADYEPHEAVALLHEAITNSLRCADERGYASVALPLVSSGVYGFPQSECVATVVQAIHAWATVRPAGGSLRDVRVVNKEKVLAQATHDYVIQCVLNEVDE